MRPGKFHLANRSIKFYRRPLLYQIAIIALLSAVITGSLLTGSSVKSSLRHSAVQRLGNTGIVVSSGVRYFNSSLVSRFRDESKINCTGILSLTGYCQKLTTQKGAFNTNIIGIGNDFFPFQGNDSTKVNRGEVAINERLAQYLGISAGDEIILRFTGISEIPADAPFAPAKEPASSVVMKVAMILTPAENGNFSLSISQIVPMNVFINLSDLQNVPDNLKINRLISGRESGAALAEVMDFFKRVLSPADIGLSLRTVKNTGQQELISDRVFIDEATVKEIRDQLPSSAPVLTYLGNRFKKGSRSTPYSFVSALPNSLYYGIPEGDSIIINKWMAEDITVRQGDTINMYWYLPDSLNKLVERNHKFIVKNVVEMQGIFSDSLLMPDFPGISNSQSCSQWDAGVPIKLNEIRKKDEDYWNKYRGTPKAFINYEKGKELWGNNFGTVTSIRFNSGMSENEISAKLAGNIDPAKTGFNVTDIYGESLKAASESVDFRTLFLSLGFFLIAASIVLLSFSVASYFDSRKSQIFTFFAMGFRSRWIENLILYESGIIALIGCFIGSLAGYEVNILITKALNSVWRGAVQTNTLTAFFNPVQVMTGFAITFLITMLFMFVKIRNYLKNLNRKEKAEYVKHSSVKNLVFLISFSALALIFFLTSVIYKEREIVFSFASGTILLIALLFCWRQYFIGSENTGNVKGEDSLSRLYYSFYPSHAVTPILFIAAGIFAVFITGANKVNFQTEPINRSGGTGGYKLWCETTIPIKENLNTIVGKNATGLDDDKFAGMSFVQAKRSSGDDASCLNLNHISSPPLLGIDPTEFISGKSFSFARSITMTNINNPWQYLNLYSQNNIIYGIADQTVLEWGLKIKVGDTLIFRAENGEKLKIIIAAGLKSSVFQGYVLLGMKNFMKYFPSVSGSSVLLVDGDVDSTNMYISALTESFANHGINITKTGDRLASFYEVTNTYLSVFGVFGALGMITGIAGLGFVLMRNYNLRKREFAMMIATGFTITKIRKMILKEQILILFAGVTSGVFPAVIATFPSIKNSPDIPWLFLIIMVLAIVMAGLIALVVSARSISADSLIVNLKKD